MKFPTILGEDEQGPVIIDTVTASSADSDDKTSKPLVHSKQKETKPAAPQAPLFGKQRTLKVFKKSASGFLPLNDCGEVQHEPIQNSSDAATSLSILDVQADEPLPVPRETGLNPPSFVSSKTPEAPKAKEVTERLESLVPNNPVMQLHQEDQRDSELARQVANIPQLEDVEISEPSAMSTPASQETVETAVPHNISTPGTKHLQSSSPSDQRQPLALIADIQPASAQEPVAADTELIQVPGSSPDSGANNAAVGTFESEEKLDAEELTGVGLKQTKAEIDAIEDRIETTVQTANDELLNSDEKSVDAAEYVEEGPDTQDDHESHGDLLSIQTVDDGGTKTQELNSLFPSSAGHLLATGSPPEKNVFSDEITDSDAQTGESVLTKIKPLTFNADPVYARPQSLHQCCFSLDIKGAASFLDGGSSPIAIAHIVDNQGNAHTGLTPIQTILLAIELGSDEIAPKMLKKQAARIVKLLVTRGALTTEMEKDLAFYCVTKDLPDIIHVLFENNMKLRRYGYDMVGLALQIGHKDILKSLEKFNCPINIKNDRGNRPFLDICSKTLKVDVPKKYKKTTVDDLSIHVRELMNYGLNLESMDYIGSTALVRAIASGNEPMMWALINCGANPRVKFKNGVALPHLAAACLSPSSFRAFIDQTGTQSELRQLSAKNLQPDIRSMILSAKTA